MTRPRIFIASAGDSADVAYAIQSNLDRHADCTVWNQGVMRLSRVSTHNLLKQLDNSDFGIFVFNPDDVLSSRDEEHAVARENVVLELGMFAGRLGVESTFIVMPRDVDIRLPSNLVGLTVGEYATDRSDGNLVAALGPVCHEIRRELKDFKRPEDLNKGVSVHVEEMVVSARVEEKELSARVEKELSARVEARIELGVALDPIVRKLASAADALGQPRVRGKAGIRQRLRSDVLNLAVKIAAQVVGPAGSTRACYLDLEAGPPMRLVPTDYVEGRRVRKRQEPFVAGTEHGGYVFEKVLSSEPDFYPNLDEEAPPGFNPRSVEYRTFISVPVVAGNVAYGLLTADARKPGDLSDVDVDFMSVMAGLVATAIAMSQW
jgi:hypothetical protein